MAKKKTMIEGFWDRFEECIFETGESKNEIARQIGCGRKSIYNDYDGRALSPLYIARFCVRYGFSADYLLGISAEKKMIRATL